jgi:hypothetical protein
MKLIEYKDMFGLYKRVKEIRPSYRLMLNRETNQIELFDDNFGGKCMTFNLPLTPDIIDKINASRIENSASIFRKIEAENMKKQRQNINLAAENTISQISQSLYF